MTKPVVTQEAGREAQISNAVQVTLSQLRMLMAMLGHLHAVAPAGTMLQTDVFVVLSHALDTHAWLLHQWNEACGPTPGASAAAFADLAAEIPAATGTQQADTTEPTQDVQTLH